MGHSAWCGHHKASCTEVGLCTRVRLHCTYLPCCKQGHTFSRCTHLLKPAAPTKRSLQEAPENQSDANPAAAAGVSRQIHAISYSGFQRSCRHPAHPWSETRRREGGEDEQSVPCVLPPARPRSSALGPRREFGG